MLNDERYVSFTCLRAYQLGSLVRQNGWGSINCFHWRAYNTDALIKHNQIDIRSAEVMNIAFTQVVFKQSWSRCLHFNCLSKFWAHHQELFGTFKHRKYYFDHMTLFLPVSSSMSPVYYQLMVSEIINCLELKWRCSLNVCYMI